MLVVGAMTAIHAARRGVTIPHGPPPLVFLVIGIRSLSLFDPGRGGILLPEESQIHKRMMLWRHRACPRSRHCPSVLSARLTVAFFGLTDLVLLACVSYDTYVHRRLHPLSVGWNVLIVSNPAHVLAARRVACLCTVADSLNVLDLYGCPEYKLNRPMYKIGTISRYCAASGSFDLIPPLANKCCSADSPPAPSGDVPISIDHNVDRVDRRPIHCRQIHRLARATSEDTA